LTYPLPRYREPFPNLFQCLGTAMDQPKSHAYACLLPSIEGTYQPPNVVLQHPILCHVDRVLISPSQLDPPQPLLLPPVPATDPFVAPLPSSCSMETEPTLASLRNSILSGRRFLLRWVSPELVLQITFGPAHDAKLVVNVYGKADGPCLISNRTHNSLLVPL
jgi:hypothetical protein